MTRKEFLIELDRRLDSLPREDADRYLAYYAEILADRMEDGMTEEEAVASMESLDTIVNRILGEWYTTPRKPKLPLRRIAAIAAIVVVAVCVAVSVRHLVYQMMVFRSVAISTATETIVNMEGEATEIDVGTSVEYMSDSGMIIPTDGIQNLSIYWTSDDVRIIPNKAEDILIECDHTVSAEVQGDTLVIGSLLSNTSGSLLVFLPTTLAEDGLGELSLSVTSAYVEMDGVDAQALSLSTISGNCTITGCFGTVEISTTNADVTLCGSAEHVTADAISGCLMLEMNDTLQTLHASSVNGNIGLTLPANLGYTLDFDTSNGSIYTDTFQSYGDNSSHIHGDGKAALTVSTVSGDVTLCES